MKQCLIETVPVGGDSADFIDSNCVEQLQATKGKKLVHTEFACYLERANNKMKNAIKWKGSRQKRKTECC